MASRIVFDYNHGQVVGANSDGILGGQFIGPMPQALQLDQGLVADPQLDVPMDCGIVEIDTTQPEEEDEVVFLCEIRNAPASPDPQSFIQNNQIVFNHPALDAAYMGMFVSQLEDEIRDRRDDNTRLLADNTQLRFSSMATARDLLEEQNRSTVLSNDILIVRQNNHRLSREVDRLEDELITSREDVLRLRADVEAKKTQVRELKAQSRRYRSENFLASESIIDQLRSNGEQVSWLATRYHNLARQVRPHREGGPRRLFTGVDIYPQEYVQQEMFTGFR